MSHDVEIDCGFQFQADSKAEDLRDLRVSFRRGLVSFVLLLALLTLEGQVRAVEMVARPTNDPGLQALQQGKVDEGARQLGFGPLGGSELYRRAQSARNTADALSLYEAYLQFFPFGHHRWEEPIQDEWSNVAIGYIELLTKSEKPTAAWFKQSEESIAIYRKLRAAYQAKDAIKYTQMTDEIVAKYPLSIFTQGAVMTTARGRAIFGHGGNFESGTDILQAYLLKMERAGVPEQDRLLVLLMYQERLNHREVSEGKKPTPLPVADILRLSRNPFVRRAYLGETVLQLLRIKDIETLRPQCRKYLAEYPEQGQPGARLTLIHTLLSVDNTDEARWWIQEWRGATPALDVSEELFAVAEHARSKRRLPQAITAYQDVIESFPKSSAVTPAKLGLAYARGAAGDNDKMLALLKEVAGLPARNTSSGIMDASNTRNRAHEALGEYYMKEKNWQEALRWWQRWQPASWCATCLEALQEKKQRNIETCMKMLKQP